MGDARVHLVSAIVLGANITLFAGASALARAEVPLSAMGTVPPLMMVLGSSVMLVGGLVVKRQAVERVIGHPEWFVRLARSLRITRVLLVLFALWAFTMAALGTGGTTEAGLLPGGEPAAAVLSGLVALACTRLMRPRTGWAVL